MTTDIEKMVRAQVNEFLLDAIQSALNSYQEFSQKDFKLESGHFKDHHTACKVAIAHIDLLLKLARWAGLPDPDIGGESERAVLDGVMDAARAELAAHNAS